MITYFSHLQPAIADPILAIRDEFLLDPNPNKIDLSVGIYQDDTGQTKLMAAVQEAFRQIEFDQQQVHYLPIDGLPQFTVAVARLIFGENASIINDGRLAVVQSIGGSSALRYGADFLRRHFPSSVVYLSDPSWQNHDAIFKHAGFKINSYPYSSSKKDNIDFEGMLNTLAQAPSHSIIILHGCCHNPTGLDLNLEQWKELSILFKKRELIPFIDFAYQGLADGIAEDRHSIELLNKVGIPFLVAYSCSKNFSLYSRRVGVLAIACSDKREADVVRSQLKRDIRANNSTPPIDGALAVALVLNNDRLRELWSHELTEMRMRITNMRRQLLQILSDKGLGDRFAFLANQKGMFSYSGLTAKEVLELKKEHSVYAIENGRICVAALNSGNLEAVASAIHAVVRRA